MGVAEAEAGGLGRTTDVFRQWRVRGGGWGVRCRGCVFCYGVEREGKGGAGGGGDERGERERARGGELEGLELTVEHGWFPGVRVFGRHGEVR